MEERRNIGEKTSFKIGFSAEIRTEHFQNTNLKPYRSARPFCWKEYKKYIYR
jgi:hypothetical protein